MSARVNSCDSSTIAHVQLAVRRRQVAVPDRLPSHRVGRSNGEDVVESACRRNALSRARTSWSRGSADARPARGKPISFSISLVTPGPPTPCAARATHDFLHLVDEQHHLVQFGHQRNASRTRRPGGPLARQPRREQLDERPAQLRRGARAKLVLPVPGGNSAITGRHRPAVRPARLGQRPGSPALDQLLLLDHAAEPVPGPARTMRPQLIQDSCAARRPAPPARIGPSPGVR